jgi:nitrite reductase/ring-hydroxylating ferredoxin subunit
MMIFEMDDTMDGWMTVAKASELATVSLKHIEVGGREIALVNVAGKFFAIGDRCGHMNSRLSRGKVVSSPQGEGIVACPLHGSTFDIVTGKLLSGPVKSPPSDMSTVPKAVVDTLARAAELSTLIKVHDVENFDVRVDGDDIKLYLAPVSR